MARQLDLNLLQALEALLAERNVTRAAVRLNTTQPALSAQLARLRRMFDDPLFIPGSRGMTPTPRALEIEERLSELMDGLRLVVTPRSFNPKTSAATISFAATDATQFLLAPLVREMHAMAPNVRVAARPVQRMTKPEIDRMLATGHLDMVIGPRSVLPDDLRARIVSTENYRCVLRKGHPFDQPTMSLDDFCALEHIFVSPFGGDFRGDVDAALATLDRARRVVVSIPSVLVATRILETSNFVGVFSESLARREAHILRSYPLPVDIGKLQLVLAWHERTHVNPAHQWFRDRIAGAMKQVADETEPKSFEETTARG
jgi:DNA-binding transcriptional LysR family regulator